MAATMPRRYARQGSGSGYGRPPLGSATEYSSSAQVSSLGRYPSFDTTSASAPPRHANRFARKDGGFAHTAVGIDSVLQYGGGSGGVDNRIGRRETSQMNGTSTMPSSKTLHMASGTSDNAAARRVGASMLKGGPPEPPASSSSYYRRTASNSPYANASSLSGASTQNRTNSPYANASSLSGASTQNRTNSPYANASSLSGASTQNRTSGLVRARAAQQSYAAVSSDSDEEDDRGRFRGSSRGGKAMPRSASADDDENRPPIGHRSNAGAGGRRGSETVDGVWGGKVRGLGERRRNGDARGLVGLGNLGNTCFMNSCLQCLSHTTELSGIIVSGEYEGEMDHACKTTGLAKDYAALIKDLWNKGGGGSVNPSALKMQISKWAAQFSGYAQHDSQELLRFLLDGLQQSLMRPKRTPPWSYDDDGFEKRSVQEQSKRMWENYLARNDSCVTDIFCGQLRSTVTCNKCKRQSNCYDPFMDLSLPIPKKGGGGVLSKRGAGGAGGVSIEECLDQFCEEESLERDDSYYCSQCKVHQNATKRMRVFRFPKVLVLHLKRFNKGRGLGKGKLSTDVKFPCYGLNLGDYCAEGSAEKTTACFDLYAMVNHSGSLNGGHYIAHCKNYDDGNWYCFNDSHVSNIGSTPPQDSSAYLLFYAKRKQ